MNILIGGKAGQGIDAAANIISGALSKEGFYVFNYRDYPSLIEGGQNFNIVTISDEPVRSYESELDIMIALDQQTIKNHKEKLKEEGSLLKTEDFEIDSDFKPVTNVFMLGAMFKKFGLDLDILNEKLEEEFEGKKFLELDLKAAKAAYDRAESEWSIKVPDNENLKVMTGSEGIGIGAIKSGLDNYFAYPMTPATPVLHYLAGRQKEENYTVFQPENELAVINAGLGSAHTGAKAMVGTSGGGYDLMQEAMSMQGIAEIPLVVYLAQRPGPGSGVPTYNTQGDLDIAVKGGHGEYPRVTVAPGDAVESVELTNQAFYFSENFRALSVLLGDKHVAESEFTYTEGPELIEVGRNIADQEGGEFDNYKITEGGNSPRSVSGKTIVKSSSYEHDEYGVTTEDSQEVKEMNDKRLRKAETIKEEVRNFDMYKVHGNEDGDIVVLGWGSTKGAILDAIRDLDVEFIQILYLEPFPDEIKQKLEQADKVILVENNSTGLLGNLVSEKTGYMIPEDNKILKYDGRPFESDLLKESIEEVL